MKATEKWNAVIFLFRFRCLTEKFLTLGIIQRDIILSIARSSYRVPDILVRF